MDWRRLFTIVLIAGAAMMAFQLISNHNNSPKEPAPPRPMAGALPPFRYPEVPNQPLAAQSGAKPETMVLGTFEAGAGGAGDKVAVTVDNVTAGIDLVELNPKNYSENAKSKAHPKPEPLILLKAGDGLPKPYATLGVHVTPQGASSEIPLFVPPVRPANPAAKAPADEVQHIHDEQEAFDQNVATGFFKTAGYISEMNRTGLFGCQYVWRMERNKANPNEADLFLTVNDEHGTPQIQIEKVIRVDPTSYDVTISHEVENLTDKPLTVSIDQMASIDLPEVTGQTDYRFYHAAGFNTAKHAMDPERYNLLHGSDLRKLAPAGAGASGTETKEIGAFLGDNPLEWVATSDRFFAAITRPAPETGAPAPVGLYAAHKLPVQKQVASANIDVLYAPAAPADAEDCVGGIRLTGNPLEIPGHNAGSPPATLSLPLAVYLGPKVRNILLGDISVDEKPAPLSPQDQRAYNYAAFQYDKIIQITTSSCGGIYSYCMIDTLAYILLRFLDLIHAVIPNYGVAIMILVLLVKAALHPLTRASQVNMAKMSKKMKDIQPLIEANKKKYAKDKQKQNEEMMRIYREHKVNPAGGLLGCLPMFLQTPIWIAVWAGLTIDINLRHAVFIPGWINDLSAPDATWVFTPFHLPIIGWKISSLNILPLLLGIVVFIQMKVQTASQPKPADDQQANMQKISSYMVLIFPLMLYSWPSGLNLYYFASTLGGLVDTYFVRKSLKRKGILPAGAPVLPTHEEKE